jgi:hypothetical protein
MTPIEKLRRSSLPTTTNEILDAELSAGNLDKFISNSLQIRLKTELT